MRRNMNVWKDKEQFAYRKAYNDTDSFFEKLHDQEDGIILEPCTKLTYREEQQSYALDIMEAIQEKEVLLVQAGVGIGKSFGYLIPIFYTYQNVPKFRKVVISTSNIALQQQLLADIHKISNMLGIELQASIAKGINNYACLKKIEHWIRSDRTPLEKKEILENLIQKMEEVQSADKEDLKEFSENIWKNVQLQSRGYCSNCSYTRRCPFYQKQQEVNQSNIIITNHANLIRNVLDDGEITQNVDMFIFDEAHQLEGNMRNVRQHEIRLDTIMMLIDRVSHIIQLRFSDGIITSLSEDEIDKYSIEQLKFNIGKLFSSIRKSSSFNFTVNNKNNHSIVDCDRLGFTYGKKTIYLLDSILKGLDMLFKTLYQYEMQVGSIIQTNELKKLKQIYEIFKDMRKLENSNNLYWASFFQENLIHLCYTPKSNLDLSHSIFSRNIPVVCTSGTLIDNRSGYGYFMDSIDLEKSRNQRVSWGESYLSPFDYENNTLFYYNPNLTNPDQYDQYILDLAYEIDQLICTTNGKALILFTSKKCMNDVYGILSNQNYPFQLFLQNDRNTNEVRDQFEQDIDSCLFATGSFWEGIDIKGKSLSNLVITHLPFDVVDVFTQYKASKFSDKKNQFQEVYIPSMLIKLEQAMGRLIRSYEDTGIISCLDSRFVKYMDLVKKHTKITNYTTNMQEVIRFSSEKIIKDELIEEKGYVKKLIEK